MGTKLTRQQVEAAFEEAARTDSMCKLGQLIRDHEFGEVIAAKVADQARYSGTTVSRVLRGLDLGGFEPPSPEVVNKHRKGTCRCPR